MANTLAEYETLDLTTVQKGIVETIVKESPFLGANLPFVEIVGNAHAYNLESVMATASFYGVGDAWSENAATWAQRTVALTILGGDADADKFIQATRKNQDVEALTIEQKAKAVAHAYELNAIMGRTTTSDNAKQFKGLFRLIAEFESDSTTDLDGINNDQVLAAHATSDALTLDLMDQLRDRVSPKPDAFMMNRRMRRKLNSLCRASGNNLNVGQGKAGEVIEMYGDIPILINDWIPSNLPDSTTSVLAIASYDQSVTRASTYDNSAIFALRFGEDGVCGLHNGGIQHEEVGTVSNKDANRHRIKFYCGLMAQSTLSAAVMINVLDTALS
ncbi:MAG: phage major capsid protein [Deltaproteobacteria bacterium]|nr:phage major capsid protein [Deltaproteobacteria bacterium]